MTQGVEYFLIGAVLLLLSILASKAASRVGVPSLVLFLVIGMMAGSDGIGGIHFDSPFVVQLLGTVALVFILFSAGFDTQTKIGRSTLRQGIALSTLGVLMTATLVGAFVYFVLDLTLVESFLFGSIVSSTDAAAVFTLLRSTKVRLPTRLRELIEFESASNDPMAILLTMSCINYLLAQSFSGFDFCLMFVAQLAVGFTVGFGMGKLAPVLFNKLNLEQQGLYPVLNVALILLTYGITTWLKGNGFLAIYLTGLVMGQQQFNHKSNLYRFHDGFVWLMQIGVFLVLGLQVFPSQLPAIFITGLMVSLFMIFVARPVAVFSVLSVSKLNVREQTMVAWAGLRGAIPIILATFPLLANISHADIIFNMVFFIVLTSVLIQATLVPVLAKWLKLEDKSE